MGRAAGIIPGMGVRIMNRLFALGALLAAVVGGVVLFGPGAHGDTKADDAAAHAHAGHFMACAKACAECMNQCDSCFHHCYRLVQDGKKEHARTMHTCADCGELCAVASRLSARQSPMAAATCEACARGCDICGAECEKFSSDEHMKQCAKACRDCAKACREMVQHAGHLTGGENKR